MGLNTKEIKLKTAYEVKRTEDTIVFEGLCSEFVQDIVKEVFEWFYHNHTFKYCKIKSLNGVKCKFTNEGLVKKHGTK